MTSKTLLNYGDTKQPINKWQGFMKHIIKAITIAVIIAICNSMASLSPFALVNQAYADPPPWAPAHGWRAKHHDDYDEQDDEDERYYVSPPVIIATPLPIIPSYPYVQVSCSNQPIIGTVIGGVAGGLIGNQFGKGTGNTVSTVSGALLGAVFGNQVGVNLSRADSNCMAQALEYARPGTQVVWQAPQENASYSILPTRNFREENGRYCREYQTNIRVSGKTRKAYGTACRQPNGQWEIVN